MQIIYVACAVSPPQLLASDFWNLHTALTLECASEKKKTPSRQPSSQTFWIRSLLPDQNWDTTTCAQREKQRDKTEKSVNEETVVEIQP